jgi:hypothetical protein
MRKSTDLAIVKSALEKALLHVSPAIGLICPARVVSFVLLQRPQWVESNLFDSDKLNMVL